MDPRMRQRSIVELFGQIIPFVQNVVATGGDPAGAINALADAWEWPELAKIYPTQDAAAFGQAVQQLAQQQSKGPTHARARCRAITPRDGSIKGEGVSTWEVIHGDCLGSPAGCRTRAWML